MTENLHHLRAREVMNTNVQWTTAHENLRVAGERMASHGIRALLVAGDDPSDLPGIITSKDIVNLLGTQDPNLGLGDARLGHLGGWVVLKEAELDGIAERLVEVAFPHLGRQLVEHFDAVAIGIRYIGAVGHPVVSTHLEGDAVGLQMFQLAHEGVAVWVSNGNVIDADCFGRGPPTSRGLGTRYRWCVLDLHDGNVVVVAWAAAIEAHLGADLHRCDLFEAHQFGPKPM